MTRETIAAKLAEHQARIDLLVPAINESQKELLQRQGAVAALQDLLALDAEPEKPTLSAVT